MTNYGKVASLETAIKEEIARRIRLASVPESLARLADELPEPVMRVSPDGNLLYANHPARDMLRALDVSLGGKVPVDWRNRIDKAVDTGKLVESEAAVDGTDYVLTVKAVPGAAYLDIFARDISRRRQAEDEARHLAQHDSLTGLPNREQFLDWLVRTVSLAQRSKRLAAVHVVGLDQFKSINESKGHEIGDKLLCEVGERLKAVIRVSDMVARIGGDEFGIVQVEPADADGIGVVAEKVKTALSAPFEIDGEDVECSASIGVAVYPDDARAPDELLRNADIALDHGKNTGGGDYRFFVSKMNEDIQRRRAVEEELRLAIDRQELEVHYQPKLDLASSRISGMEALVRWNHPDMGFLSPAEFIPIAERSRLIVPLGDWVLGEACRRAKQWNDAGLGPLKVAVNLSAVQFHAPSLIDRIKATLEETGLDADYLELEITETVAMEDAETAIDVFEDVTDLGVALSIDDFGTGYSSLSYLKSFPVHRIKIDKAFIDDIGTEFNRGAIARAVTTLGHSFGMEITAEGVEEEDQVVFLHGLACNELQGYYFSKPLKDDDFRAFVEAYDPAPFQVLAEAHRPPIALA